MTDFRTTARALWRWRWLIGMFGLVSCVTAATVSYQLPKTYASTAVGLVSPKQLIPPSGGLTPQDLNQVPSIDNLVETYVGLVNTEPVRDRLVRGGVPRTADELKAQILAVRQPNSTLIGILVTDRDPAVAQSIARDIIPAFNDALTELQSRIGNPGSRLDSLVAWELPAQPPTTPISPDIPRNTLIGLGLGLVLGIALALLLERLDDTIKQDTDVRLKLDLPLLGSVIYRQATKEDPMTLSGMALIASTHAREPVAEQYRGIRTNLLFSQVDAPTKALVVTSTSPGEGKTTTACNLAVVFAQAGRSVILVDADFRRPALHKIFHQRNNLGLGHLILDLKPEDEVIMDTPVPNLRLICSGPVPPNPSELLGSASMHRVLERLGAMADVVILDTAPIGAVTDGTVLGAICDGLLLVVERGGPSVPDLTHSVHTLHSVGANLVGVVLNKAKAGDSKGYYYYGDVEEQPSSKPKPKSQATVAKPAGN